MTSDLEAVALFRRENWVTQVARHAQTIPDQVAFVSADGVHRTWDEIDRNVRAVSAALRAQGISAGDRVLLLMTNRPEFIESIVAVNRIGAIAVPANWRLVPHELAYIAMNSGATALVFDAPLGDKALEVARTVGGLQLFGFCATELHTAVYNMEEALASDPPTVPPAILDDSDIALIMYTAGTTGRPKGAALTHGNLQAPVSKLLRMWQVGSAEPVTMVAAPLFHIGALSTVSGLLYTAGRIVFSGGTRFDAGEVLDVLASARVSNIFLVPAQWAMLAAAQLEAPRDVVLDTLCWGGEPASISLLELMEQAFPKARIVGAFGQTETTGIAAEMFHEDAKRKVGSVGRAISPVAVRVVDQQMRDVPVGEVGEIVYRGQGVMRGYWENPEATAEAFAGGWFHSGDLVRMDEEGFIFIVDRAKDMIISGGENIYSAELEQVLGRHPKVFNIAVVGAPHPKWGETPVAFVEPVDRDDPPILDELIEWSRDTLSSYKRPTRLIVSTALPRSGVGKILKHDLRKLALASDSPSGAEPSATDRKALG